jgi:hypothetical protein
MKLLRTIKKLVEEAEERYNRACDKGEDEKTISKLEKDYYDSLKLMKKINVIKKDDKDLD